MAIKDDTNLLFYHVHIVYDGVGITFELLAEDDDEVSRVLHEYLAISDFSFEIRMKLCIADAILMFELQRDKKYYQSFQLLEARNLINERRTD